MGKKRGNICNGNSAEKRKFNLTFYEKRNIYEIRRPDEENSAFVYFSAFTSNGTECGI